MTRGRKPTPPEILKLRNNPGKRKIPEDIPQPKKIVDALPAPNYLDETGKEVWDYLAPKLVRCGILSEIDIYTLENCCVALSVARKAIKELSSRPLIYVNSTGTAQKTPFMAVYRDALDIFDTNGSKLGLSPSDRVRLKGITKKESDEFDEFLKTGKAANG